MMEHDFIKKGLDATRRLEEDLNYDDLVASADLKIYVNAIHSFVSELMGDDNDEH
jgi:hypothetical protein